MTFRQKESTPDRLSRKRRTEWRIHECKECHCGIRCAIHWTVGGTGLRGVVESTAGHRRSRSVAYANWCRPFLGRRRAGRPDGDTAACLCRGQSVGYVHRTPCRCGYGDSVGPAVHCGRQFHSLVLWQCRNLVGNGDFRFLNRRGQRAGAGDRKTRLCRSYCDGYRRLLRLYHRRCRHCGIDFRSTCAGMVRLACLTCRLERAAASGRGIVGVAHTA